MREERRRQRTATRDDGSDDGGSGDDDDGDDELGFDHLTTYGFGAQQIAEVRERFLEARGHLPAAQRRQEEEEWMNAIALISLHDPHISPVDVLAQNMVPPPAAATPMSAAIDDVFPRAAASATTAIVAAVTQEGSHFDFLVGAVAGFVLGPILMIWLCCEDSLTGQFRLGLVLGLLINAGFGLLRLVDG
ncbi:uncharacterized protein AMSG_01154 [Thecamonas trahens ATCC 50062]|uniref:DSC E3 ubiquitin ligase complex subunit 3 C-terminal domain-containing protein n=1 Tax=Thecamonas trahens ATCC 50062 TaxID=461836 RepID=A0A0L0DJ38_THETB|nr:hypothetical protein AMSG_01154 [Thecamonas trahens ATCC 50062]KNC52322.1 hypothetical protein AMSG_01154 [Thecamonas trahens ATCC 50062]|eukprot:XP_013762318.1 hypothetical protein AMSG_01154 [Thecamonas trahens ATCC 50062]